MRHLTVLLTLALAFAPTLVSTAGAEEGAPTVRSLAWLAGCWAETTPSRQTLECWTDPQGGLLLGIHRDVVRRDSAERASFEYLRIEDSGQGPVYQASPGGRGPTPFRLTESSENSAVFENPDHDFPRRIVYRLLDDGRLYVTAEGDMGGETRKLEWTWSRTEFPGS